MTDFKRRPSGQLMIQNRKDVLLHAPKGWMGLDFLLIRFQHEQIRRLLTAALQWCSTNVRFLLTRCTSCPHQICTISLTGTHRRAKGLHSKVGPSYQNNYKSFITLLRATTVNKSLVAYLTPGMSNKFVSPVQLISSS